MRLNVVKYAKSIVVIPAIVGCSGCGTMTTLSSSDAEINRALVKRNTYCVSVPRVYSGAYYDVCHLHAKQIDQFYEFPDWTGIYLVDIAFSGILDTVVLPFTIYSQFDRGSVEVEK